MTSIAGRKRSTNRPAAGGATSEWPNCWLTVATATAVYYPRRGALAICGCAGYAYGRDGVSGMSAEASVALFGVGITLLIAVLGFMWRSLGNQIGMVRSDLEGQIGAMGKRIDSLKTDLEGQIGALRNDLQGQIGALRNDLQGQIGALRTDLQGQIGNLAQQIADSEARAEKAHARIESNIKDAEGRLLDRIDNQTERIDALHRDLRGLGERVATVEARA